MYPLFPVSLLCREYGFISLWVSCIWLLGALPWLQKAPVSFVSSVRLSACICVISHWTDFLDISE
jgi:hypothetical protein